MESHHLAHMMNGWVGDAPQGPQLANGGSGTKKLVSLFVACIISTSNVTMSYGKI